jgi:hypothetical protein
VRHLFLCLVFCSSAALADIGSVTEISGSGTIKRGKDTVTIAKGTVIQTNDKVETKNGKIKIVFKDNTTVSVTEHSSLVIDDFVYDPKNAAGGKLGLKATGGAVRYVSGAIAGANPNSVKINTPTAAIAVRGTDFVMAVNETGASTVILMPSCEDNTGPNVKGAICGSGAIDVESGPNLVTMNRPFQATMVETAGAPPTPPLTVNLFAMPVGTNLLVSPPPTMSGAPLVAAARAAAAAAGVPGAKKNDAKKESKEESKDGGDNSEQVASNQAAESKKAQEAPASDSKTTVAQTEVKEEVVATAAKEETKSEDPEWLRKIYKDKSETKQVGWAVESVSQNGRNVAQVSLQMNTQVQVNVTQDMMTISNNFSSGRAQGQIIINQTYR